MYSDDEFYSGDCYISVFIINLYFQLFAVWNLVPKSIWESRSLLIKETNLAILQLPNNQLKIRTHACYPLVY